MIVVLDTNVLFSAFAFPRGVCAQLFRASLGRHQLATSTFILEELGRQLTQQTSLANEQVHGILRIISEAGPTVVPAPVDPSACRDASDLPVLGTVVAAGASVLVTGDADLLTLGSFQNAVILAPRGFIDRFLATR